jgi:hypothetical protein
VGRPPAKDCPEKNVKVNYLLIDLENVKPENLGLVSGGQFKIKVFVVANQKNVPLAMAQTLQSFGPDAEYIQIESHGKNALDFHIAFYIGRLAMESPGAFFHIISGDTGFDPLIRHLKTKKILCLRSTSIEAIPLVRVMNSKSLPERVAAVIDYLKRRQVGRPRTVKTLGSSIRTQFGGQMADDEVSKTIEALAKQGAIAIDGGKVAYTLPE